MTEKPKHRARILVVYQYIALYRIPVFEEMARSEEFEFEFLSGTEGRGETPKLATRAQLEAAPFPWMRTRNTWLPGGLLWQWSVLPALMNTRYDGVVFLGDPHYLSTWVAAIAARLIRKPIFFWTIGMHRPDQGLTRIVRNLWHKLPRLVLVYGEYAKSLMVMGGLATERIAVIGNSLDFEEQSHIFEGITKAPPLRPSVPLLIAIGRVTARRQLDKLIEAVALLTAQGVEVRARIIGDGSARLALENLANKLGVAASVEFLGAIYDETIIARHMYEADLCVVPGIIGLGAIHAHSYGTPVITCGDWAIQAPEAEVIVPDKTGGFCRWDDAKSVAEAIQAWLSEDREREQVRRECRAAVAQRWTPVRQRELIETAIRAHMRAT
jgi:glycosyltransferase involved in cell wall biosynthesis